MNAQPKFTNLGPGDFSDTRREEAVAREEAINARAEQLVAEMWQDPEYLTDALGDAIGTVGYYRKDKANHPLAMTVLTLLRDGSDDIECMRIIREAAKDYIRDTASDRAEEEMGDRA